MRIFPSIAVLALAAISSTASAESYTWRFDGAGNVANFQSMSRECPLTNPGSGGNPGGYLQVSCGSYYVAAYSKDTALTGNYTGARWRFSVDVAQLGSARASALAFTFLTDVSGWVYTQRLDAVPSWSWRTIELRFDANWTDEQARAAGWRYLADEAVRIDGFPYRTFKQTMHDVSSVRLEFPGGGQPNVRMGLDNIDLRYY